jgi:hypothetical protein
MPIFISPLGTPLSVLCATKELRQASVQPQPSDSNEEASEVDLDQDPLNRL